MFLLPGNAAKWWLRILAGSCRLDSERLGRLLRWSRGRGSYKPSRRSWPEAPPQCRRRHQVLHHRRFHRHLRSATSRRHHIQGSTPRRSIPPNEQGSSCAMYTTPPGEPMFGYRKTQGGEGPARANLADLLLRGPCVHHARHAERHVARGVHVVGVVATFGRSRSWCRCKPAGTSAGRAKAHAANLRSPSRSVRNPTTWFQLGVMGDAPEIPLLTERASSFCRSVTTSCRLSRFQSRQLGALGNALRWDR